MSKGLGRVPHRRPPKETVELEGINRPGNPKKIMLEKNAAAAYKQMVAQARLDGLAEPLFLIVSGLRDQKRQKELYAKALVRYGSAAEARKWVAPPGKSAHETGCAVDMWLGYPCGKETNEQIKATAAYKWLAKHANDYGFNPYPLEGWHWEYYVGG
jgi:D-alanyl-D-alanine carboxypeptidase